MQRFFFSILTAIIAGSAIALGGIKILALSSQPRITVASAMQDTLVSSDGEEEDPTFISNFSRGLTYSAGTSTPDDETISSLDFGKISAQAYLVTNLDRNNDVLEKDADRLMPIASITKIITAAVAKKLFDEDDLITITPKDISVEGNTGKLKLGEKMKVKEILYPLLMVSSNDAAQAIADAYDAVHGRGKFVKEMNAWAGSIGAYRTYFKDASGLSSFNVSTARDISIIAKWVRKNNPEIFEITLTKTKTVRSHTWVNPTHFLNLSSYLGGKNGYIPEAGRTSLSLFTLGFPKRLYSVVLLGSEQRDADTLAVLNETLK